MLTIAALRLINTHNEDAKSMMPFMSRPQQAYPGLWLGGILSGGLLVQMVAGHAKLVPLCLDRPFNSLLATCRSTGQDSNLPIWLSTPRARVCSLTCLARVCRSDIIAIVMWFGDLLETRLAHHRLGEAR